MTVNCEGSCVKVRIAGGVLALTAMLAGYGTAAQGQLAPAPKAPQMTRAERSDLMQTAPTQTFFLKNSSQPNDANEILTGLRLMLDPAVKIYLVPRDNAIIIRALPEDVALASKLISELDQPRKTYRLTYTLTEMEGGKRTGTPQHFTMVASSGQRVTMKAGSKVPVATGSFNVTNDISEKQMTYLDVGYNFDSTVIGTATGGELKSKVERSSVAEEKPAPGAAQDPTIHQEVIEGVTFVPLGKTLMLGSLDVPDSTRRLDVEVMMELVP